MRSFRNLEVRREVRREVRLEIRREVRREVRLGIDCLMQYPRKKKGGQSCVFGWRGFGGMELQVYTVSIEDRLPRGLPAADVSDVDVLSVKSYATAKTSTGCVAVLWGRTATGESVAVRV